MRKVGGGLNIAGMRLSARRGGLAASGLLRRHFGFEIHLPFIPESTPFQKMNFRASWTNLGLTAVVEIRPKSLLLKSVAGLLKLAVLNRLKNSERNSRLLFSMKPNGIVFTMDMSVFL